MPFFIDQPKQPTVAFNSFAEERNFAKAQTSSQAKAYQQEADAASGGDNAKVTPEPEVAPPQPVEPQQAAKPAGGDILHPERYAMMRGILGASSDKELHLATSALADWYEDNGMQKELAFLRSKIPLSNGMHRGMDHANDALSAESHRLASSLFGDEAGRWLLSGGSSPFPFPLSSSDPRHVRLMQHLDHQRRPYRRVD